MPTTPSPTLRALRAHHSRTPAWRAHEVNDAELRATLCAFRELSDEDWQRPTVCTGWTVRDMLAHVVGQYEELPALARPAPGPPSPADPPGLGPLAGHNECQIEDRRAIPGQELIGALADYAPRGCVPCGACRHRSAGSSARACSTPRPRPCPTTRWTTSTAFWSPATPGCTESTSAMPPDPSSSWTRTTGRS
ncbi:maleylpyruvate isomerase N-terminal domain-containing protein [Streptomyces sp. M10(2022)]